MTTLLFKRCPKCRGDLLTQCPEPGECTCLQCGYVGYTTPPLPYVSERPRPTVQR